MVREQLQRATFRGWTMLTWWTLRRVFMNVVNKQYCFWRWQDGTGKKDLWCPIQQISKGLSYRYCLLAREMDTSWRRMGDDALFIKVDEWSFETKQENLKWQQLKWRNDRYWNYWLVLCTTALRKAIKLGVKLVEESDCDVEMTWTQGHMSMALSYWSIDHCGTETSLLAPHKTCCLASLRIEVSPSW